MAIAHFDTLHCYDIESKKFDVNKLVRFKAWLVDKTQANAYAIGLGGLWFNTAPSKSGEKYSDTDDMRFDLINKVKSVFNNEPIVTGRCIRFQVDANEHALMEGSMSDDWMGKDAWRDSGEEIPYNKFR